MPLFSAKFSQEFISTLN